MFPPLEILLKKNNKVLGKKSQLFFFTISEAPIAGFWPNETRLLKKPSLCFKVKQECCNEFVPR